MLWGEVVEVVIYGAHNVAAKPDISFETLEFSSHRIFYSF